MSNIYSSIIWIKKQSFFQLVETISVGFLTKQELMFIMAKKKDSIHETTSLKVTKIQRTGFKCHEKEREFLQQITVHKKHNH